MLPSIWATICFRVGFLVFASSSAACMIWLDCKCDSRHRFPPWDGHFAAETPNDSCFLDGREKNGGLEDKASRSIRLSQSLQPIWKQLIFCSHLRLLIGSAAAF